MGGLLLLTLAACEPFGVLGADDVVVIDGEDRIGVKTDALEFGTVSALASLPGEQLLHVENLGDTEVPVYIDATALTDTPYFLLTESRIFSLAKGESADVPVYFAPTTDGVVDAELVLQPGNVRVKLHAVGTAPVATVEPVDLGKVVIGCDAVQALHITNTGSEDLTVNGATSDSDDFMIDPSILSLAPGESADLPLTFTPSAAVAYAGEIVLLTNDPSHPRLTVPVSGSGDDGQKTSETFEYALGNPTDVLVLVDNGPSMDALLGRGVSAVDGMVETLQDGDTDFHLAALDLDGDCPNGNLAYATPEDSTASAESMLKSAFHSLTEPHEDDDLLPLALEALEGGKEECLAGFRRDDASLHIVGITDGPAEDEFATNLAELDAQVLPPFELTVSTITPSDLCGARALDWADAALDADGAVYDACQASWDAAMRGIAGRTATAHPVSFYLAGRPVSGTIEVLVEGVTVTEWKYEDDTNAIVFPVESRPPRGASIEARYVDASTCEASE